MAAGVLPSEYICDECQLEHPTPPALCQSYWPDPRPEANAVAKFFCSFTCKRKHDLKLDAEVRKN